MGSFGAGLGGGAAVIDRLERRRAKAPTEAMPDLHAFVAITSLLACAPPVKRFQFRDGCTSIFGGGFLLAAGSMVLAVTDIVLGAMKPIPPLGTIGFGIAGLPMPGVADWQAFTL